jgi:hypothetical protein
MINTKVLTKFLGEVCQDGVEQALLVDEGGSVLGAGTADGFDSSVSYLFFVRAVLCVHACFFLCSQPDLTILKKYNLDFTGSPRDYFFVFDKHLGQLCGDGAEE